MKDRLPRFLRRQVLHFECLIEDAVHALASSLPAGALVLDAGSGEGQYRLHFDRQRYLGVDLGLGDVKWNYSRLDAVADLARLPFPAEAFDAALHIVTLEHVPEPLKVLQEISRVLRPGAPLLIVVPQEWEVHQAPHDYYRYTRYGISYLLESAGFQDLNIQPAGGFFRLLSRRLYYAVRYAPAVLFPLAALAMVVPLLEPLERDRNTTLGYICSARKR